MKTVDLCYATFAPLSTIPNQVAGQTAARWSSHNFRPNSRNVVSRGANIRRCHFDPSLIGNKKSIDDVDASTDVAQKARQERAGHGSRIQIDDLARKLDSDFIHGLLDELRLKSTQALRQR